MQLDVLLTTLPPNYLNEPTLAPALLKSALQTNGFSCQTVDFAFYCYNAIFDKDYTKYINWGNTLNNEYNYTKMSVEHKSILDQTINKYIQLIKLHHPKFLALSIFSVWQQRFAYLVCAKIRELRLDVKIIIGGMGVSVPPSGLRTVSRLSYFDIRNSYGRYMDDQKLVDYVILNDGELELVKLLKDYKTYQSTFEHNEVTYDNNFYPNFDDFDLDNYLYIDNEKTLLVAGSKGCVRQCVFCSEHSNYSKYYFKSGVSLADEIIFLSKKYNVYKFHLTDSLVNGSLTEFKEFTRRLARYNQDTPGKEVKWHGNYICRTKNNMTDEDFRTLKLSGAIGLTIGAESGSNQVLQEMKKKTTVEDLLYEISKFEQHGINCSLLFMIGFYSETWKDFLMTLELVKKLQPYFYTGTVSSLRFGYTLSMNEWQDFDLSDFTVDYNNAYNWTYFKNLDLTLKERVRRRVIVQEFCDRLGIPVGYAREDLQFLDLIYNNNINNGKAAYHDHH